MSRLLRGDAIEQMQTLDAASIDACVTDPPYGLSKEPDMAEVLAHWLAGDVYAHGSKGFMGRSWDSFVPGPEYWREVYRVMKPGAWLVAFAGTRTFDLMSIAIRMAGFTRPDTVMFLHGQGFPKGKGQLKPAWEPIILARKAAPAPWLNVDGCRLYIDPNDREVVDKRSGSDDGQRVIYGDGVGKRAVGERFKSHDAGRWPANVVLDEEAAAMLDEQGGERPASGTGSGGRGLGYGSGADGRRAFPTYGDTGGASRFFYCSKASAAERRPYNDHPTVKPLALMQWLVRLVTPPGGTVLDPFMGSGSTLIAADREGFDAIGIDSDPHAVEIARRRLTDDAGMFADVEAVS